MPFARFVPQLMPISGRERLRSALGAFLGILGTYLLSRMALGEVSALPVLVAPMGASAVLLFAVPASPLAQPWSILGGNLVASLVGVTAARLVGDPALAAALAVSIAIALMTALRCLHPPSGAVALTAVLGGPAITGLGYGFVLWPIAANSILLLATALLFNNLAGRPYPPHRAPAAPSGGRTAETAPRLGFTADDLDAAMRDFDRLLEIDRGDLETILRRAELNALGRRSGPLTCADIMVRDVVAIDPEASLKEALTLLRRHHIKALPVTDERARVLGIVTQTDLLDKAQWSRGAPRLGFSTRLRLSLARGRAPRACVDDIMTSPVRTAAPHMPIGDLVPLMMGTGLHHLPVVETDGRLAGMVALSDLFVAMLSQRPREPHETRPERAPA
ncbi:HPP family protein [Aurantimonas sp. Leaf443]|uniref:HPP family protein n=1 Tax=Aurantimonas sp. Leaf443 TaxID=1736378 RepID=UPI0006F1D1DB|nr:HPP family protein [Aurantimonas sp. Leaf443]KQT82241.1 hypothetical protein ASG48_16555 [Aurantimonas sp. Leaf443]